MLASNIQAQLVSDFTSSSSVCQEESLELNNLSSGALRYEWDFCVGDTPSDPDMLQISGFSSRAFGFRLVEDDGLWYGFYAHREDQEIYRINYGSSPLNTPIDTVKIVNPNSVLNTPVGFDIVKHDGSWFAVFGYDNNGASFGLVDFGSDITNKTPTGTSISNFGETGRFQDLRLISDEGNVYLIAPYYNGHSLYRVNFGNSLYNTPAGGSILENDMPDSRFPRGIDVERINGEWKVFVVSQSNSALLQINLGSDLMGTTFNVENDSIHAEISSPYRIEVVQEGSQYYAFISNSSGSAPILNLKSTSPAEKREVLGYNVTIPSVTGLDVIRYEDKTIFHGLVFNKTQLRTATFTNECGSSSLFSSNFNPSGISYITHGDKEIELRAYSTDSVSVSSTQISVLAQTAPIISFNSNNVCINSLINFDPTNTGLTSYDWDFDGDGMIDVSDATGAAQSFDYSALGTGTYTVRLDVSDGTCNNFFEQEITIYDPPPAPSYTFSSPRTCINTDYTFSNTTVDGAYSGPLEYLWEFIDEPSGIVVATANTRDAIYAFETEGLKTVRLTSSIPGCTEVTEQNLTITPGPSADFFAASVCQNEAMQFTNTSADAVSYFWDFGDGFSSTAENPSHIFNGAGNFFVTLTATDIEGCSDSEMIEVAVSDSPQISFDFDVPCTSTDGIQFFDLTTVDNADLVSWRWFVDDVEVSTLQSPQIVFESTGVKNIRLDVQSSNGCESSFSEDIDVLTSPNADFNINLGCLGEPSTFTDVSTSSGNSIVSWLWSVEGVNYNTQDINHTFSTAGTFDVTLEVTGQNFCSETITKSVEVIQLPSIDFSVNGECDNQIIRVFDQSTDFADPITSRRWTLNGSSVGNGSQLFLSDLEDDTYELALELETEAGCTVSSSQSLVINDAPSSSFTSSRTFGIPNDQLTFTNTSTGGASFQWLLDGELRSTAEDEEILFSSAGSFEVSLVSQNSFGCYDTATQQILIATPEVDLVIGSFELVNENSVGRIFLEIQNFSNLPVESVEARIVLENTFAITEQIVNFIDVGESSLVSLNAGIPLAVSEPAYFCVTLISPYEEEYSDLSPVNNEKCITIEPVIQVEDPFPNPVTDQFRLKLVTSENGAAKISLFNSSGKVELSSIRDVSAGLNNYFIDMSTLYPGIYYVVVDVLGTTHRKKVIKL